MASQYLIVGAKFRPPASGLLEILPTGTELVARREPSNPYDANAIIVLVRSDQIEVPVLLENESILAGYGYSAQSVLEQTEWQLGYIPREWAAKVAPLWDSDGTTEQGGHLTFSAAGLPSISLSL